MAHRRAAGHDQGSAPGKRLARPRPPAGAAFDVLVLVAQLVLRRPSETVVGA